jgi:hypothetical protein
MCCDYLHDCSHRDCSLVTMTRRASFAFISQVCASVVFVLQSPVFFKSSLFYLSASSAVKIGLCVLDRDMNCERGALLE